MSNADRQRRFRQQRKDKTDSIDLKNAWFDLDGKPQDYARQTLALMLALIQHGSAEADSGFDDDVLTLRVRAAMDNLPQDVVVALRFGMRAWLSEPTRELWRRDGKIDLEITIAARTDKRKRKAIERKLAAEEEEK
jgi:hypothetical protein